MFTNSTMNSLKISNTNLKYIYASKLEAYKSPCLQKHGCIAVINGTIFGRGYNHYRTNTRDGFVKNSCTCHAEMAALRDAYKKLNLKGDFNFSNVKKFKKITIYITRIDKTNNCKESGPCIDCLAVIKKLKIKRIIYSTSNDQFIVCKPAKYMMLYEASGRRFINKSL